MKRLTTRSIQTAEAIRDREDFNTSGNMNGRNIPDGGLGKYDDGRLLGDDLDKFREDCYDISYCVWSYATPIAWYVPKSETRPAGRWHKVAQKFSVTTTKHQGNLYLI